MVLISVFRLAECAVGWAALEIFLRQVKPLTRWQFAAAERFRVWFLLIHNEQHRERDCGCDVLERSKIGKRIAARVSGQDKLALHRFLHVGEPGGEILIRQESGVGAPSSRSEVWESDHCISGTSSPCLVRDVRKSTPRDQLSRVTMHGSAPGVSAGHLLGSHVSGS